MDNNHTRISTEIKVPGIGIQAAFLASEPGHPLLKQCMTFYEGITLNEILQKKLTAPTVLAYHAEMYGFIYKDVTQRLKENIHLYTTTTISNYNQFTSKSIAVHFCAGSWVDKTIAQKCLLYIKSHRTLFLIYTILKKLHLL